MRIGLVLDPAGDPGDAAAEARLAEDLGYDLVSCGEHVFFHGPASNAFVVLAAAAAVTTRIRLLSSLTILPLYPVALAAKMAATLDRVSRGRFELGVGVGGESPAEFAASGVDLRGRGRRTDEALEVLTALLRGESVTASGSTGTFDGVRLDPPPVQRPRPPLWVGGRAPAAQRRAGRFADVWMPYMVSPESFARSLAGVREASHEAGRESTTVSGALFAWGSVAADPARARSEAVAAVGRVYAQDFEPLADRYLLHGDAERVAARIRDYAEAGAGTLLFSPACDPSRRRDVITDFAASVVPLLPEVPQSPKERRITWSAARW